jgi:2,3-bisphosphoglycerate-independent phosphoglycerate mutase
MSVMGYDPGRFYTGRGPLEAADMGVRLDDHEIAFRCNFITAGENLVDFTAGHISTREADVLISDLNAHFTEDPVRFHTGTSYRHLMVYSGGEEMKLKTVAPHDVVGEPLIDNFPQGKGARAVVELMHRSRDVLQEHDVNRVRRDLEQNPADMIWLWSPGRTPALDPFADRFGCRGAAISAVNLICGIARLIGWDVIDVPGITGYVDTDYAAKGRYAIDALGDYDLVFVHIEAPDEAAHEGDVKAKIRAIEQVDREVVGPIMAAAADFSDLRLMILPDHLTSVETGKHTRGDVPFAISGAGVDERSGLDFTESNAAQSDLYIAHGHELMEHFIRQ